MQVHSITRFIAAPFLIALVYIFVQCGLSYEFRDAYGLLIFPLVIILVALYVFSPQIDFWYHQKHPVPLDEPVIKWLEQQFNFYQQLSDGDKTKFRNRLSLFMEAKEFFLMKREKINMPEDMKMILSAHAIQVSFGQEDYLLNDFARIIAYMHPFPTPFYPHLHSVEVEESDGVLLFNFAHVLNSLQNPSLYNVALHGFIEAYLIERGLEETNLDHIEPTLLSEIAGISSEEVANTIGFERDRKTLTAIHHFYNYSDRFKSKAPALYAEIKSTFNL